MLGFAASTFASHVTTSAGAVSRLPDGIGHAEAATIPTTFLTAFYALDHLARLRPGERVLIHGAAGGVGLAAVQVAQMRGAVVFGSAGSEEKRRVLRLLGVDHVLNSRSLDFADAVMRLTGGQGVDVVLNSLAGEAITKNLQILRPFGRFLEIGKRDFHANSRIGLRPFRNNLSYFGIDADTLLIERADLAQSVFAEVMALFAQGALRPLPFTRVPVSRAAEAFRLMQQSRHIGKIVLTMAPEAAAQPVVASLALRPDATYLVTGGLGGFGLATAGWLVERGARSLALIGRRGATTDEARAGIAAMEAAGATVRAFAANVAVPSDVAGIVPTVQVVTQLPAASADVVTALVTASLERQFGQIPGLLEMSSTSGEGTSQVTLQFALARRLDGAAQDVQSAINAAAGTLPPNLPYPPVYARVNPADAPILTLALQSESVTIERISDAADTLLQPKLSQVGGVGRVTVQGRMRPAIRVRADPARLAIYGLSMEDVRAAVAGAKGGFDGPRQATALTANDQLRAAADYKAVVIAWRNGATARR